MEELDDSDVTPVTPRDPHFPMNTVPAYLTPEWEWLENALPESSRPKTETASLRILDFGRGM